MTTWEFWGPTPESLEEHKRQKAGEWWDRTSLEDYEDLGKLWEDKKNDKS